MSKVAEKKVAKKASKVPAKKTWKRGPAPGTMGIEKQIARLKSEVGKDGVSKATKLASSTDVEILNLAFRIARQESLKN